MVYENKSWNRSGVRAALLVMLVVACCASCRDSFSTASLCGSKSCIARQGRKGDKKRGERWAGVGRTQEGGMKKSQHLRHSRHSHERHAMAEELQGAPLRRVQPAGHKHGQAGQQRIREGTGRGKVHRSQGSDHHRLVQHPVCVRDGVLRLGRSRALRGRKKSHTQANIKRG